MCLLYPSENGLFPKDDPAKGSMHSFLMSTNSQQDISTLDAKVCYDLLGIPRYSNQPKVV